MGGEARYEEIARHLRQGILAGTYPIHSLLPTLSELAVRWHVTRGTAQRSVQILRQEGLVTTRGRKGTRVVSNRPGQATVAIALAGVGLSIRSTEVVGATEGVAADLGVSVGSAVLVVRFGGLEGGYDVAQDGPQQQGQVDQHQTQHESEDEPDDPQPEQHHDQSSPVDPVVGVE